jgi:hypothetical protein
VPVPASVRPPAPEMTPANVVEVLLPPVGERRARAKVMALVALALAMEPTVLLKPCQGEGAAVVEGHGAQARRAAEGAGEPAVSVPPLTVVAPE